MARRVLVVCPGRGSYDRSSLGYLSQRSERVQPLLDDTSTWRAARGRPSPAQLDAEPAFRATHHVAGEHASLLTFTCSMADWLELPAELEVVGVAGNSMGWYTALVVAGALSVADGVRLVDQMGAYQEGQVIGGQILYPVVDDEGRPLPDLRALVERICADLRREGLYAGKSIELGGYLVLGADTAGCKRLLELLPPTTRSGRLFPQQLPLHSAFHTPLLQPTSERARTDLQDLRFQAPRVPLVDGHGRVHWPRLASPALLADYTLGAQVVEPYDFSRSILTALAQLAPDQLLVLGPGNSLGGPLARLLVQAGWRGIRSRSDLEEVQRGEHPLLLALGVPAQRARVR